MKKKLIYIILFLIFFSCDNSKPTKEEIEKKAINITEILSDNKVNLFKKWNYSYRGGEWWSKQNDSKSKNYDLYVCYKKQLDTTKVFIYKSELFSPDFNLKYKIDTSKVGFSLCFSKYNNSKMNIEYGNKLNKETIIKNLDIKDVFYEPNPFKRLDSLSKLKNELKVFNISYNNKTDIISFYLSYNDILYYVPNKSTLNPTYKKYWIEKLSKSKEIKKGWYLSFDDKKLDNG